MVRKIIAGAAVAGALTMGVGAAGIGAGVAGAAGAGSTPTSGTSNGVKAALCARLPKLEARIHNFESKVDARLPKAEAREAKLRSEGHTKAADAIAKRITFVQNREHRLNTRLSNLEARCGTSG